METEQLGLDNFDQSCAILRDDSFLHKTPNMVYRLQIVHLSMHYIGNPLSDELAMLQAKWIGLAQRLAYCRVA